MGLPSVLGVEGPESIASALAVLAGIIFVHECGHFLAARLQGIHVTKFAVGFGPSLLRYQGPEVEYSLRAIPFGGFVAFPDDDEASAIPPDDPDLLRNRPIWSRAVVVSAGVVANVVFAFGILLAQMASVGQLEQVYLPGVRVPVVAASSAAARAGLLPGDIVTAVDGVPVSAQRGAVNDLVVNIKERGDRRAKLTVQRLPAEGAAGAALGGQVGLAGLDATGVVALTQQLEAPPLVIDVVPDLSADGSGRIGVQLSPVTRPERHFPSGPSELVSFAAADFGRLFHTVSDGLSRILFNFAGTVDQVSGPVAIVAVGAEVARADPTGIFQFAAVVNINLAIVNVLPLPALDGGYLALLLLEATRGGKKLSKEVEQSIQASGTVLLVAAGGLLLVRDTLQIFNL